MLIKKRQKDKGASEPEQENEEKPIRLESLWT